MFLTAFFSNLTGHQQLWAIFWICVAAAAIVSSIAGAINYAFKMWAVRKQGWPPIVPKDDDDE